MYARILIPVAYASATGLLARIRESRSALA